MRRFRAIASQRPVLTTGAPQALQPAAVRLSCSSASSSNIPRERRSRSRVACSSEIVGSLCTLSEAEQRLLTLRERKTKTQRNGDSSHREPVSLRARVTSISMRLTWQVGVVREWGRRYGEKGRGGGGASEW
jgi:hypothetical protein